MGGTELKDLESRVAYVEGLVRGLRLREESEEGRILAAIVDLLGELAGRMATLERAAAWEGPARERPARQGGARQGPAGRFPRPVSPEAGREGEREEERETFIACECPGCGAGIFASARADAGEGPRRFQVACAECGFVLDIRETPAPPPLEPGETPLRRGRPSRPAGSPQRPRRSRRPRRGPFRGF